MSAGGPFQLIVNDGRADRILNSPQILRANINNAKAKHAAQGMSPHPTIADIEQTHILYVSSHFKPFVTMGYEYQKIQSSGGNIALGNEITFELPQFGDFIHDIVGRQVLSSFESSSQTVPTQSIGGTGGAISSTYGPAIFPGDGYDWDNTRVASNATYSVVDVFGNTLASGDVYKNLVRYCEYPGERLYNNVDFKVNGNPLDNYNYETMTMLRKFKIGVDKLDGYKRLVGQETEYQGYSAPIRCTVRNYDLVDKSQPHLLSDGTAAPTNTNAAWLARHFPRSAHQITPDTNNPNLYQDVIRKSLKCTRGPQSPKYRQPELEIWIPLQFWFCNDVRISFPSLAVPFGQRTISIGLCESEDLVCEVPGIYIRQVIYNKNEVARSSPDAGFSSTIDASHNTTITYRPYYIKGAVSTLRINTMELYANNIFLQPEIHDIFLNRIGFTLIRVYRYQDRSVSNNNAGKEQLLQIKWPIEYIFLGFKPDWNTNKENPMYYRDWHRFGRVLDVNSDNPNRTTSMFQSIDTDDGSGENTPNNTATNTISTVTSSIGQIIPDSYAIDLPVVKEISVNAHNIKFHENTSELFFNSYIPFHYGHKTIVTPKDRGVMMINFSLFPGMYNPSGHLNMSRAREFFIGWTTDYITATNTAKMVVVAIAINFLLISNGNAILRYAT